VILPGIQLEKLCAEACKEILLVAPFIKASVLKQLLGQISSQVTVKCVTRWQPEEILAGVSDLEVWSLLKQRPQSFLWLRPDLHAKYYRADDRCLVGSANLTAKALGWSNLSNFELLIQLPATQPNLQIFETELFKGCIQVDESLFKQMSATLQLLTEQYPKQLSNVSINPDSLQEDLVPMKAWLPTLRNPEDLYLAYSGQEDKLTLTARDAAAQDLRSLSVIPNLTKKAFIAYVGIILLQKPIIQQVDSLVTTPQRFGAVRDLLASLPCAKFPNFHADRAWQTLMRWLLYFLRNRYAISVPNYSEVFYRLETYE
jgi:hypothetical protein